MTTIPVRARTAVSKRRPAPSRSFESLLTLLILLATVGHQAAAQSPQSPADKAATFDIPAQSLEAALIDFSKQANVQVMVDGDVLKGHETQPLRGTLDTRLALATLLKDTGLEAKFAEADNTVTVTPKAPTAQIDGAAAAPVAPSREQSTEPPGTPSTSRTNAGEDRRRNQEGDRPLEEIVVTGSHIRGETPVGTQLLVMDRSDIDRTGLATVQDVVRTLPQTFAGGPSEDTRLGQEATFNSSRATGINLRGLGAGSTLVLVNGRRLAPGGSEGRFADLSVIPLSAVDRIEVLADGASAIYGADAVGGVVNVSLRKEYRGAESQIRFGSVTEGSSNEMQLAQAFGTDWRGGNGLISLEYYERDALRASERAQSATSDLRPFGGSNFDVRDGNPGTILAGGQTFAIPRGQDGGSLTPADFTAGTINLHNRNEGADLLPEHERWSGVATVRQELSSAVSLFADVLFSRRETLTLSPGLPALLTVPDTNPFYVNPTGGTGPIRVRYSFTDDLGSVASTTEIQSTSLTAGTTVDLGSAWQVTGYVGYSGEEQDNRSFPFIEQTALDAALADPNPATAFNPFGDGSFTNPATLAGISVDTALTRDTTLRMANITADGPLLKWRGREAKLAIGIDYREQTLDSFARRGQITDVDRHFDRDVKAAFAELSFALIDPERSMPGLRLLDLSLAGRYEEYSDFGNATTPKVGLAWSPIRGVSLRGTWSESFKAPNLVDLDESLNGSLITPLPDPASPSGFSDALIWFGNNADLLEETATTRTLGLDIRPASLPHLSLGVTYFDIEFEDRVNSVDFVPTFLEDPQLASFVTRNPTAEQREVVCSRGAFVGNPSDCLNAPIAAIVDIRVNNVAVTETSGFDLLGTYSLETGLGQFNIDLNATYLLEFAQAVLQTSPLLDQLNTQNNPIDLRVRAGLSWSRGPLTLASFINYVDSYKDTASEPDRKIGDWTTVDLQVSYDTGEERSEWLDNIAISLSVQNLFDEDPPFFNNPVGRGYDPENADLLGRFVSAHIRKHW